MGIMIDNFDQKDFAQRVNEELLYLGMEKQHLANCIYISEVRLTWGLRCRLKFKPNEVKAIEKILGMD